MRTTSNAFAGIIILAQCFGMLPMIDVRAKNIASPRFEWKSFRFLHATIQILLLTLNALFYVTRVAKVGLNFSFTVTLMFFTFGPVSAVLLLHLAIKWPTIMRQWVGVDVKMKEYGFPPNLKRKLGLTAIFVMGASLVEHGFFLTFSITNLPKLTNSTHPWEEMNRYLADSGAHIFEYVPYNPFFGLVFKLIDITITFVWNFIDMFIMTISIALAARFRQINNKIEQIVQKMNQFTTPENKLEDCFRADLDLELSPKQDRANGAVGSTFRNVREDYNLLCRLTAVIDEAMAHIILLSFANNLFLILVQLLHSIEPQEKTRVSDRLYFAYSFGFLILRACAVALTSSQIYAESRRPSWYLTTQLPEAYYDDEVERLLLQIRASEGCFLTGNGFFKVKSSLILSIAGAIVSYELILVQFKLNS